MLKNKLDDVLRKRFINILKADILADGFDLPDKFSNAEGVSIPELSMYQLAQSEMHGIDPQLSFNRVMIRFVGGDKMVNLIHTVNKIFPSALPKLFLKSFPALFHWLVGDISVLSESEGKVLSCRYLREGGETACMQTCKKPTEAYFKEVLGIDLKLNPNFNTSTCDICCKRVSKNNS